MDKPTKNNLYSYSLAPYHLSQALRCIYSDYKLSTDYVTKDRTMPQPSLGISCIIHSFCAIESWANFYNHNFFNDLKFEYYIKKTETDINTRIIRSVWRNLRIREKILFMTTLIGEVNLSKELLNKLDELNSIRNWLAHGNVNTIKFDWIEVDGGYWVSDDENIVQMNNWEDKFLLCKFNPPQDISINDGLKAFSIAVEVIRKFEENLLGLDFTHISFDDIPEVVTPYELEDLERWLSEHIYMGSGISIW
jgi:hypothetical protein